MPFSIFATMSTDLYAEKYKEYSQDELQQIIDNEVKFGEYARLGAIKVMELRNGVSDELESLKSAVNGITTSNEIIGKDIPTLYSKLLIRMFSLFLGTIFGVILLMYNMRVTDNKTGRWQVLSFGVIYMTISVLFLNKYGIQSNYSILINLVGGFILTEYFWNKFIGKTRPHEKKGWKKPTITALVIVIPLTFFYMKQLGLI